MKFATSTPIQISEFLSFFEATLRALPSGVIAVGPFVDLVEPLGLIVDTSTVLSGSSTIGLYTGSLAAQDVTDLFTTPLAEVDKLTITKTGQKWTVVSARLTPSNMAENLSGLSSRVTLSGLGELVSGIVAGDGTGTQTATGIVIDQANSRACIINGASAGLTLSNVVTPVSGITEIVSAGQGFFERA